MMVGRLRDYLRLLVHCAWQIPEDCSTRLNDGWIDVRQQPQMLAGFRIQSRKAADGTQHQSQLYRLRVTKNGKLLLNK